MFFDLIQFLFDLCWFILVALINVVNTLIMSIVFLIFIAKIVHIFTKSKKSPFFTDSPQPMIIAYQGAGLDVEPNSKASIEYVSSN